MAAQLPQGRESTLFSRVLMLFVPDAIATAIGSILVGSTFALGLLEMFSRNVDEAEFHFYLAFGMMAFLITMKYMSLRANFVVAQTSHSILVRHIRQLNEAPHAPALAPGDTRSEEEISALERQKERAEMVNAMDALRDALKHIQLEDPARPKYEATIELMERILQKS